MGDVHLLGKLDERWKYDCIVGHDVIVVAGHYVFFCFMMVMTMMMWRRKQNNVNKKIEAWVSGVEEKSARGISNLMSCVLIKKEKSGEEREGEKDEV